MWRHAQSTTLAGVAAEVRALKDQQSISRHILVIAYNSFAQSMPGGPFTTQLVVGSPLLQIVRSRVELPVSVH